MSRLFPRLSVAEVKPTFLLCDLQEKFADKIPRFADSVFESNRLAQVSQLIGAPFIVTEQYPKGLGKIVPQIRLPSTLVCPPIAKTKFSMITDEVIPHLQKSSPCVLWGIEAHVCVLQTVADLLDRGHNVWVVSNATFSQYEVDRQDALSWFRQQPGCTVTTTESLLLQMVRDATDPNFKAISQLLRERQPSEVRKEH
jgi:hypothetical protein